MRFVEVPKPSTVVISVRPHVQSMLSASILSNWFANQVSTLKIVFPQLTSLKQSTIRDSQNIRPSSPHTHRNVQIKFHSVVIMIWVVSPEGGGPSVTTDATSPLISPAAFSFRSVVYQQNSKESATLQPFFTLQLDIQSEKIRTVQEALETMVARESVQGYTSKTKQEVGRAHSAARLVPFASSPPIKMLSCSS